jgi:hypothetical protein
MKPTSTIGLSQADSQINQSRREALKRFGRYAAAAPAAMVLLQSQESLAGPKGRKRRRRRRGWRNQY